MRRGLRTLAGYFLPSKANRYKPGFFTARSVGVVLALLVLLELALLAQSFLLPKTDRFLTAVLPGALVAFSNDARANEHLPLLRSNSLLVQAARAKAEDMALRGYFSHETPEGKEPWIFLDAVHYEYGYAGENLAVNFTDSKDVTDAWLLSPTHRANLLNPHFSEIGIGVATGTYQGKEAVFVVQFLASPTDGIPSEPAASMGVVPAAPVREPSVATTSRTLEGQVKAAQVVPLWERVASSPRLLSEAVTYTALFFITLLFAAAIVIKTEVQHREVWSNGLLAVSVLIGLLLFQHNLFPRGTYVPENAASVHRALEQ